ncbi:MAG: ATP-binding protein [Chitinophagaceae bacterium]
MSFEPILLIFLVLHLRKIMRTFSPEDESRKFFTYALYGIIALAVLQSVFNWPFINWIWEFSLLFLVLLAFKKEVFSSARTTMNAVLPLVGLALIDNIVNTFIPSLKHTKDVYGNYAIPVAVTWMVALLILANKQQKAIKSEHLRRLEEDKQKQEMAARKEELEALVTERTNELMVQKEELEKALLHLKETQAQLIQKEKMASLGELTAGIAHEIQNPLNFINNFSEVNAELASEIEHEIEKGNKEEIQKLVKDIEANSLKIVHHGKLADAIVKSMLQHSQSSSGIKEAVNINLLADEYLRLSYHGLRSKDKTFMATMKTFFDEGIGPINIVPQEVGRVLLNLFNNAFYSVLQKKKLAHATDPTVSVRTTRVNGHINISVRDNGMGIPDHLIDKIYQPFFTTKPTGKGTGLGLSLSYDIIKAHGGNLSVYSKEGEYAEFVVSLPA